MNGGWIEGCGHIIFDDAGYPRGWRLEDYHKCPTCDLARDDYPADRVRKKWQKQ